MAGCCDNGRFEYRARISVWLLLTLSSVSLLVYGRIAPSDSAHVLFADDGTATTIVVSVVVALSVLLTVSKFWCFCFWTPTIVSLVVSTVAHVLWQQAYLQSSFWFWIFLTYDVWNVVVLSPFLSRQRSVIPVSTAEHLYRETAIAEQDADAELSLDLNFDAHEVEMQLAISVSQQMFLNHQDHVEDPTRTPSMSKMSKTSKPAKEQELRRYQDFNATVGVVGGAQEEDDPECLICREPLVSGLRCPTCTAALFHELCIRKWAGSKPTCPSCKEVTLLPSAALLTF